jgi:hypothetical protein
MWHIAGGCVLLLCCAVSSAVGGCGPLCSSFSTWPSAHDLQHTTFQGHTAVLLWHETPCRWASISDVSDHLSAIFCNVLAVPEDKGWFTLKVTAVRSFQTSETFHPTILRHIPRKMSISLLFLNIPEDQDSGRRLFVSGVSYRYLVRKLASTVCRLIAAQCQLFGGTWFMKINSWVAAAVLAAMAALFALSLAGNKTDYLQNDCWAATVESSSSVGGAKTSASGILSKAQWSLYVPTV